MELILGRRQTSREEVLIRAVEILFSFVCLQARNFTCHVREGRVRAQQGRFKGLPLANFALASIPFPSLYMVLHFLHLPTLSVIGYRNAELNRRQLSGCVR